MKWGTDGGRKYLRFKIVIINNDAQVMNEFHAISMDIVNPPDKR